MSDITLRSGTVSGPDGTPVAGAFVTIKDASVRVPELAIQTDTKGHFEIRLPPGVFTLRAHIANAFGDTQIVNPDHTAIDIVVGTAN